MIVMTQINPARFRRAVLTWYQSHGRKRTCLAAEHQPLSGLVVGSYAAANPGRDRHPLF